MPGKENLINIINGLPENDGKTDVNTLRKASLAMSSNLNDLNQQNHRLYKTTIENLLLHGIFSNSQSRAMAPRALQALEQKLATVYMENALACKQTVPQDTQDAQHSSPRVYRR
ncbi:MAG: hypothetical protein A3F43_05950 [Gammaproteobacteria bacterium RIFCSPHIGHO2_12_FULL_42_10]|nr:MAG: hypothetical protein A3F43_05950 [Gammaproteobacteria bacterium RIFCSPHIGHO2_12_FULL_42_10]